MHEGYHFVTSQLSQLINEIGFLNTTTSDVASTSTLNEITLSAAQRERLVGRYSSSPDWRSRWPWSAAVWRCVRTMRRRANYGLARASFGAERFRSGM